MKNTGQINRGSVLGEKICKLSKQEGVDYILEIGTWNGLGSTKCIIDGIKESDSVKKGMSIDCNLKRCEEALGNLVPIPKGFVIKQGTIVDSVELEPLLKQLTCPKFIKWLQEDLKNIRTSANVFDELPMVIDLCIIDGGEFSGALEFAKLWKRCRYIILDDTNTFKHSQSRKYILQHPDVFNIIIDERKERNGFLICKNKKYV